MFRSLVCVVYMKICRIFKDKLSSTQYKPQAITYLCCHGYSVHQCTADISQQQELYIKLCKSYIKYTHTYVWQDCMV